MGMCKHSLAGKWLGGYVDNLIPMKMEMWVSGFVLFAFKFLCIMYRAGGAGG
jgi:hypothetical protein